MSSLRLVSLLFFIFLPGCMVGPKYQKPSPSMPKKYRYAPSSACADLAEWWKSFQDPYLDTLIERAIENNYELQIAFEKINEIYANFMIQKAGMLPEIDLFGYISRSRYSVNNAQNSNLLNDSLALFTGGFYGYWELDLWGKLRHQTNAAYAQYQAQIETMRGVYLMLLSEVAKTYVDIRTAQTKIDLLNQQIDADTKLLGLTGDRFSAGLANVIDNLEQASTLQESHNQLLLARTQCEQALHKLANLLGENPEDFMVEEGAHKVPQSNKTLSPGLPSQLLRARPDIAWAERQLAAATENVGSAIADMFPSFMLLGTFAPQSNCASTWFTGNSITWSFGPAMRLPILDFGRVRYNIKAKKSSQRQALLTYAQTVVNALTDVENQLVEYLNNKERVNMIHKRTDELAKEQELVCSLLQAGLKNEMDFLNSQKKQLQAQLELVDAQSDLSVSLIAAYKSLGGNWCV